MQSLNEFYEEKPLSEEPKDRTKWVWLGVVGLFLAMVLLMWAFNYSSSDVTRVRARHILIKFDANDPAERAQALDQVTRLREDLLNGASFSKLAKEYSNDEYSSARGGDLGYYQKGVFEPAFEEYVWAAPIGELSDIVQSSRGFHLIIVTDRHISEADSYEKELEEKARGAQDKAKQQQK